VRDQEPSVEVDHRCPGGGVAQVERAAEQFDARRLIRKLAVHEARFLRARLRAQGLDGCISHDASL
jgi:hypothetical protein